MPLSKTDPYRYSDAATFAALAAIVTKKFEDFSHEFATEGEAASFSQRFYTYRKAVTHRYHELLERKNQAQVSKDQVKKMILFTDEHALELQRMKTQMENMQDIIIKRPGKKTILMTSLIMQEDKWANSTSEFLEKHLTPDLDIG